MTSSLLLALVCAVSAFQPAPFTVRVTYYEGASNGRPADKSVRMLREFCQDNMGYAMRDTYCKATEMNMGWVSKPKSRWWHEVGELTRTSVEPLGYTANGVRLAGSVAYWEDTATRHTKTFDGEYPYGTSMTIRLPSARPERQVWAVILVSKK